MARDRSGTRAKLFDAAASLIAVQGLHATTTDQIAERAGVAKGTIYYHFKTKDELFQALLVEGLERLANTLRAQVEGSGSGREMLARVVTAEYEYIGKYQPFARLVMSQLWQAEGLWSDQAVSVLQDRIFSVIREVLEAGQAQGEFRANLNPAMAAPVVFGMVATAALALPASEASSPVAESWPSLIDMALGTVCK